MSPTSVCYTVTKIESGTENLGGGSGASTRSGSASAGMRGASGIQFGIRKQEKVSVSPLLKVGKDSHRIRKPPLPLPQVQYRPPIIIHTYSPKVIHTQPDDFMSLVQKLTGSSDTRLRLKRKPASKKSSAPPSRSPDASEVAHVVTDLEQQGSKASAQCGSPSSSEEYSSFMANSEVCVAGDLAKNPKQSHSPRSPLSNFEFDNQEFPFIPFDPSAGLFSHVKTEPSFAFNDNSFNFFTDFSVQPTKPGSMKQPAPKAQMLQPQEYSPFHSIDINSPLPSSGFLSSGLMAGLPDLSPVSTSWSQSFLDCLSGSPSSFTNQPPIQRQRFSGGYTPSSEGTMVALENIQAFMLT